MSRPVAEQRRIRHPWALAIGLALVLPQIVICVVVLRDTFFIALFGFLLTIGSLRLGSLGYRAMRERVRPVGRGWLLLAGIVGVVVASLLRIPVAAALTASPYTSFQGAIWPAGAAWLNLVSVLTLALWPVSAAIAVWAIAGLIADRRRA